MMSCTSTVCEPFLKRQSFYISIVAVACIVLTGCAKYQFHIVEPAAQAQLIERKHAADITIEPLHYQLQEIDKYLAIRIENPTDEPITILSERSYVVDPDNETHALRGGTIAPQSFVTFSIPPLPYYRGAQSRFSIGFGVGTSYNVRQHHGGHHHHHHYDSYFHSYYWSPAWYAEAYSWRWKTGLVRLSLVGESSDGHFEHNFLFDRVRVK
jgi:hypothetical protein